MRFNRPFFSYFRTPPQHFFGSLRSVNCLTRKKTQATPLHPLMIERGRHLNIPRTERYCLLCKSNQIEDEKHVLLHCTKFNTQRNIFNENISNILENASYKNANNKISFLFNNTSYSILRLTSSFISNCLNIRKDLL